MTSHPSFLELDAHALSPRDDETARHVRECQQCTAHVAAVRMPSPFPNELAAATPPPRRFVWWPFALATVAACAVLILVTRAEPPHDEVITPKGGIPAASLWLKRGDTVTPWKPGERVTRDAAVRWEIAPAGFTHVRVLDGETNTVLFETLVPGDAPVLTPAWTFDGARPAEKIRVVLTRDDAPLRPGARCNGLSGDDGQQWCSEYVLELEPR